jgi:hypothetical protein
MYICGEKIANELSFINHFRNSHLVRPNVGYLEVLVNGWPGQPLANQRVSLSLPSPSLSSMIRGD